MAYYSLTHYQRDKREVPLRGRRQFIGSNIERVFTRIIIKVITDTISRVATFSVVIREFLSVPDSVRGVRSSDPLSLLAP